MRLSSCWVERPRILFARSISRTNWGFPKGFADQPYYGDVTLTEDGYRYGAAVLERHELLRKFLTKVLGIPEDTAEEEACLMEHAISDESFKKWNSYIKQLDL